MALYNTGITATLLCYLKSLRWGREEVEPLQSSEGGGVGEGQCGPSDNKDNPIWENGYRGGRSRQHAPTDLPAVTANGQLQRGLDVSAELRYLHIQHPEFIHQSSFPNKLIYIFTALLLYNHALVKRSRNNLIIRRYPAHPVLCVKVIN